MLIKNGDDGYLPQLWDQIRKLIAYRANIYYKNLENKYGVEVEDLIQCGYFAVLKAIEYYEPEKELKFTTYLVLTVKTAFVDALGVRTSKRNPIDASVSLDAPVGAGMEDVTLLENLSDLTPEGGFLEDEVLESVYVQELREALEHAFDVLTATEQQILKLKYFFHLSLENIAHLQSCSKSYVSTKEWEALQKIRRSRHMKDLASFLDKPDTWELTLEGVDRWYQTASQEQKNFIVF